VISRLTTLSVTLLTVCLTASAGVIDVTYTVSGSPGSWDLNFTVTNNLIASPTQDVYQFGVVLSAPGITGSPAPYDPNTIATQINFFNGGSANTYNNNWADFVDFNHLLPGTSLSGFMVNIADAAPPSSVPFYAFSVPSDFDPAHIYGGPGSFNIDPAFLTAGFEGTAVEAAAAATPEASTIGLMAIGLGLCGIFRRRIVSR
jgi:hypothetical protein